MEIKRHTSKILEEISFVLSSVDQGQVDVLADAIIKANTVVVCGAGRIGMAMRGFGMRLGHLGFRAHVLGDATVPSIGRGDLLVVGSGSGETQTIYALVQRAKENGARVALITGNLESSMGKSSDVAVLLPAPSKTKPIASFASVQPMTTLNEQSLGILLDALVLHLMEKMGETHETMWKRHSNLE